MVHINNKWRKKIWSLALCVSMILSCMPVSALAETDSEYVYEHIEERVYDQGREETTESTETTAPAYTAEDVKAMMDALPSVSELESMEDDELNSVYEQAQEVYNAFEALTAEKQIELADELVKLRDVLDFMTTRVETLASASSAGFTVTAGSVYKSSKSLNVKGISSVRATQNGTGITLSVVINVFIDGAGNKYPTWTCSVDDFACDKEVNVKLENCYDTTNVYRTTLTIARSAGHSYGSNDICEVCGSGKPAEKNSEGYYEIGSLGQLMWFAQQINGGQITAHKAKLTADITIDNSVVWTAIALPDGSANASTFDGGNHTITFANTKEGSTFGLFRVYHYSTIQNLYLAGSITCNSTSEVGALVDRAYSTVIKNVISTCTVNNSGSGPTGGLTGYFGGGSAAIENSAVYADVTGGNYAGGLIGSIWNGNQKISYVKNCAYKGNVTGSTAGALVGYNGNNRGKKSPFTNVYFCESDGISYLGATYGGTITLNKVEEKTAKQFENGEVTYLLNNGVTDGTQTWYQTLGTDTYPKFAGKTVYGGYVCGSGNETRIYQNSMDGLLETAHPKHDYGSDGACIYCGAFESAEWDGIDKVYKIYNISQLRWFANEVSGGSTAINGRLMADVDVSSLPSLAIGVSGKAYSGTFDGNGYTLTIGLDSIAQYAAPFQYVNGATIKNLIVKGTITTNQKFAASIIGISTGTTKLENCLSYVTINSSVSGDGTHGGLVANVSSGTTTINNCGFVGAINGSNTTNCGGLVGWSNGTTAISNSYVAATFSLENGDNYTFSRNAGKVSLINCYYLNAMGTAQGEQITAEQLASGEVAWLMNGSDKGTWKQTIGTDNYPNFSGAVVYQTSPCVSYSNTVTTKEHDYEYGTCKYCGEVASIVPAIWNESKQAYEIYSASQLVWFAGLVNGTLEDAEQNQFANAILMNDIDMSAVTDFVPIGCTTDLYYKTEGDDKGYQGTFGGNGHIIKNLSVKGSDTDERAYGVFGTLSGTVKHLGVESFAFTVGGKDCRAGGIAGQMLSGSLITDCYVANPTITATDKVAGGIAGCNYAGTIQNCFTYKVTVTASRSGGIVGDNRGDNSTSDRLGTVSNCYTDSGSIEGQSGTVKNSTSSVRTTDFASGKIGFLLNAGRDFWKQTIGVHSYPVFNGNVIEFDAYEVTGAVISAKITWTAMEFTYTVADRTWDPDTHSYSSNVTGTWSVADGGGTVNVENLGECDFYAYCTFASNIEGIQGRFSEVNPLVQSGASVKSELVISGTPAETGFDSIAIGSVNVSLSLNSYAQKWETGDTVTWYGDNGVAYTCKVIVMTSDKYVLMTKEPVEVIAYKDCSAEYIMKKVEPTGGRLPKDGRYAFVNNTEYEELVKLMDVNECAVVMNGNSVNYLRCVQHETYSISDTKYLYYNHSIYLTFDVPII